LVLAVPFAYVRHQMSLPPNAVGIEANIAFFGFSLMLLGLFNLTFFISYYKNIQKVGKSFVLASTVMFFYITVMETLTHILPFFRDRLDTVDALFFKEKLIVLVLGAVAYVLFTKIAYALSVKNFEKQDI